jgi:hypothetical protein
MTLTFDDTKFKVQFNRIVNEARNPRAILLGAGREVANRLKSHFRKKDRTQPNKLSGRRAHFWLQIAGSVQNPELESPTMVSVTISDPRFAQKLFGGTITAKNAEALTIPVEERAYDRTAATFERETGLKLFLVKSGAGNFENAVLAVKDNANSKAFTVEYLLTPSVTQRADTDALPDKTALEMAVLARAQKTLDRQIAGTGPNPETT